MNRHHLSLIMSTAESLSNWNNYAAFQRIVDILMSSCFICQLNCYWERLGFTQVHCSFVDIWPLNLVFFPVFWAEAPTPNGPDSQPGVEEDVADKEEEGSEDEWEQVGPRNKTSITRQADFVRTPITDIFGGHIRYWYWPEVWDVCQWVLAFYNFCPTNTTVLQVNTQCGLVVVTCLDRLTWGSYSQRIL